MVLLSLYETCRHKVTLYLRDGFWKSGPENPFCELPSNLVQDLVTSTLRLQRPDWFRAADLELLLTSGRVKMLKINRMNVRMELVPVLKFLASACQQLEALQLTLLCPFQEHPEFSKAVEELLRNSPHLKCIHCSIPFDLTVLRNCKELKKVKLCFEPNQRWYDFLEQENCNVSPFKPARYLELFSVLCPFSPVPYDDVEVILSNCPALTSLGFIESSGILAHLHRAGVSSSDLKLSHCYWGAVKACLENEINNPESTERIKDAVLHCSKLEELHFRPISVKSVGYLCDLRSLTFLDIVGIGSLDNGQLGAMFIRVMEAIGHQLKCLSFSIYSPMDVSLLLQHCPNLESLQIGVFEFTELSHSSVCLPHLKCFSFQNNDVIRVLKLLCNCNQITDLFMIKTTGFDDTTLHYFLQRNSLANLKVAFLRKCSLTKHGFKKLLESAPHLEKIEIKSHFLHQRHIRRALRRTNHKAVCNKHSLLIDEEFFRKKYDELATP